MVQEAVKTAVPLSFVTYLCSFRSRMHFPAAYPVRTFSQWPGLSEGCSAVLFPINTRDSLWYFTIPPVVLSSIPGEKGRQLPGGNMNRM